MKGNKCLKRRKWYSTNIKPPYGRNYIVMTDMGYIFEATYEEDGWHLSEVKYNKVYFPLYENQCSLFKWMKV